SHRNTQVFEFARLKNAIHQIGKAMIAGEAEARNTPPRYITELEVAGSGENLGQGSAASIGCAKDAANARARAVSDGDPILFKNLQDAEMGKAACKSAAEGQADAGTRLCGTCLCFAADWDFATHG